MKKTLAIAAAATVLYAHNALAATGGINGSELGLAGWLFIGFMALIVVMQLVPAVMMFGSMMSAVFSGAKKFENAAAKGNAGNA